MDEKLKYVAVTDAKTGELFGMVNFIDNNVIQKDDVDIRIGYGEPSIKDIDGKLYMNLEKSETEE